MIVQRQCTGFLTAVALAKAVSRTVDQGLLISAGPSFLLARPRQQRQTQRRPEQVSCRADGGDGNSGRGTDADETGHRSGADVIDTQAKRDELERNRDQALNGAENQGVQKLCSPRPMSTVSRK